MPNPLLSLTPGAYGSLKTILVVIVVYYTVAAVVAVGAYLSRLSALRNKAAGFSQVMGGVA